MVKKASGAFSRDIGNAFTGRFGYSQAEYKQHYNDDYTAIMDNIRLWRPVILGGCDGIDKYNISGCHSWVCDGFQQVYSNGYGYLNFHMNWGWGGQYNGWFQFDDWTYTDIRGTKQIFNIFKI